MQRVLDALMPADGSNQDGGIVAAAGEDVLERLLQPLGVAGLLAHQLLARAQERAQFLRRRVRNEAGPDQAVRQELR